VTLPNSTRVRSVAATDVAAVLLVVAALGHAVEIGHHGALFGAVGAAQLLGAFMLVRRPTAPRRALAIVGLLALGCLWAFSRTVGLPLDPYAGHAEAIGLVDGLTVTAQLAAVVALLPSRRRVISSAFATTLVVMAVVVAMVPNGSADPPDPTVEHGPADIGHHDGDHAHTHP
jgi:hypothetical protein